MASEVPETRGGYKYEFVSTPLDRVICVICQCPSRDPYLSVCCGHVFCKSCTQERKGRSSPDTSSGCPMCRDEKFVTYPNKQIDREVKSLDIYCTNKKSGCRWIDKLSSICGHLSDNDGCQFAEVECGNLCGDRVQRRHLLIHEKNYCSHRKVECTYCHVEHFADGTHLKLCLKVPLPCPNYCKAHGRIINIPREDMDDHRNVCPLEIVKCEYHKVGCDAEFPRKDQNRHNGKNTEEHMMFMQQKMTKTEEQLKGALKRISSLEKCLLLNQSGRMGSSGGSTVGAGWLQDELTAVNGAGTHLSIFMRIMKGEHDEKLTWPLKQQFQVTATNQVSNDHHRVIRITYDKDTPASSASRVENDDEGLGLGIVNCISVVDFYKNTPFCQYVKDDCAFFKVLAL
ncbi:TNF receptor-associated factor 4-like [Dysidea avara]|uniref:TNF receptor-associated factor 4-like n=1 Tax=Dysidea avara TaxID=196820 RepID=UPI00332004EA